MASYYQILEVSHDASSDEIRKAFRTKAKECHPDISRETGAKEKFQKLNEAHQVLIDPEKRRIYDMRLRHGIVVQKVYYRPAAHKSRPVYKEREVRYAKKEPKVVTQTEKIFDKVLFFLLLTIGLYGVFYGVYRMYISPPKNDDINPVHGLIAGLVFTALLVFFHFRLIKSTGK